MAKTKRTTRAGSASVAGDTRLGMLLDVPLKVSVELGRTKMPIQDLLRLAPGGVVELDRLAGEPLDITVNGKLVARGEAVVVNERLGVRITEIIAVGRDDAEALDESA